MLVVLEGLCKATCPSSAVLAVQHPQGDAEDANQHSVGKQLLGGLTQA